MGARHDGPWSEPTASKTRKRREGSEVKKIASKAEVVAGQVVQRVARAAFFGVVGLLLGGAERGAAQ